MQPDGMSRDRFMAATGDAAWASVDELVRRLDEIEFWTEDFIESSLEARKKQWVRREIKTLKDDDGWPLFASVTTVDVESGDEQRIYKQELMFDRDDYVHVVTYHRTRAEYHRHMATGYAERANRRFDMQLTLEAIAHEAIRS